MTTDADYAYTVQIFTSTPGPMSETEELDDLEPEPLSDEWWEEQGVLFGLKPKQLAFARIKHDFPSLPDYKIAQRAGYGNTNNSSATAASRVSNHRGVKAVLQAAMVAREDEQLDIAQPKELLGILTKIARNGKSNAERHKASETLLRYQEVFRDNADSAKPDIMERIRQLQRVR